MTRVTYFQHALSLVACAVISLASLMANPVQTVRIGYSDLNLENIRDFHVLGRRISRAVEKVCGSYAGITEVSEIEWIDKCRKAARQQVAPQMAHLLKRSEIRLSSAITPTKPN